MNYTKLAKEARKLYDAFREEHFDENQSYYLTKECIRDYPIFREMIEKEEEPGEEIGYLYFIDGSREPIYKYVCITGDIYELHTKDNAYRQHNYIEYGGLSFSGREVTEYLKFINKNWEVIYTVDHIEFF